MSSDALIMVSLGKCALHGSECEECVRLIEKSLFSRIAPSTGEGRWSEASVDALVSLLEAIIGGDAPQKAAMNAWVTIVGTTEARFLAPLQTAISMIRSRVSNGVADFAWPALIESLPFPEIEELLEDSAAARVRELRVRLGSKLEAVLEGYEDQQVERSSVGALLVALEAELAGISESMR